MGCVATFLTAFCVCFISAAPARSSKGYVARGVRSTPMTIAHPNLRHRNTITTTATVHSSSLPAHLPHDAHSLATSAAATAAEARKKVVRFGEQTSVESDFSRASDIEVVGGGAAKDSGIDTGLSSCSNQTLNEDFYRKKVSFVTFCAIFPFLTFHNVFFV